MASSYRMQCWHPANPVEQTLAWFSNPKATRTRLRHRLSAEQTGCPRRLLLAQRFGAAAAAFGRIELSGTAAFERVSGSQIGNRSTRQFPSKNRQALKRSGKN